MPYHTASNGAAAALKAPVRNHYFFGKLLDEHHLTLEQSYVNDKRWLLNRLGLGAGVLDGLEVALSDDGASVIVRPGVAIVPSGREVIVPEPVRVDNPRQPTDDRGRPSGDALDSGVAALCLAYHECDIEPAPVLVADCDIREECKPSAVRERYRLLIRAGVPAAPGGLTPEQCTAVFPDDPAADFDRRRAACEELTESSRPPADDCVVLATITIPEQEGDPLVVDPCTHRSTVYSNARLLDLILCLAERVDECCRTRAGAAAVIRAVWPPNDVRLTATGTPDAPAGWFEDFRTRRSIELTFDRELAADRLADPAPWLRLWLLAQTEGGTAMRRMQLTFMGTVASPVLGEVGISVAYQLGAATTGPIEAVPTPAALPELEGEAVEPIRALIQIRAEDEATQIVDKGTPPQLLDADFAGVDLSPELLDQIWELESETLDPAVWKALDAGTGNALPSGDEAAGGRFSSFFEILVPPVPPVIRAVWPPNAAGVDPPTDAAFLADWRADPRLEITFDRAMAPDRLDAPDAWLRLFRIRPSGVTPVPVNPAVTRIPLAREAGPGPGGDGGLEGPPEGFPVVFKPIEHGGEELENAFFVVQIRAEDEATQIVDVGTPPQLLDADFAGTGLATSTLDTMWSLTGTGSLPADEFANLQTKVSLPDAGSGDRTSGGRFHSWFAVPASS